MKRRLAKQLDWWRGRLTTRLARPSYVAFLAVVALLNVFLAFFPVELFIALRVLLRPREWWRITLLTVGASLAGVFLLTELVSARSSGGVVAWATAQIGAAHWETIRHFVEQRGAIGAGLVAMSFLPLPPAILLCALSKVPGWQLTLAVMVGHLVKYGGFAALAAYSPRWFGTDKAP